MKFVCRRCEAFMTFDEVEGVREDSLGVTFGCPQCGVKVAMVTNAGETQMVKALGVQLGGRAQAPVPMELTRQTLASSSVPKPSTPASNSVLGPQSSALKESMGKCPFANMVKEMSSKTVPESGAPGESSTVEWAPEARERLERVPDFVRSFAKTMIEDMARQNGSSRVDAALMDAAKERFM